MSDPIIVDDTCPNCGADAENIHDVTGHPVPGDPGDFEVEWECRNCGHGWSIVYHREDDGNFDMTHKGARNDHD